MPIPTARLKKSLGESGVIFMGRTISLAWTLVGSLLAAGSMVGCDSTKSDEKIKDIAGIQGEAQANAGWEVLDARARAMEEDLKTRQRFYHALEGTYDGTLQLSQGDFKIRLTLSPSLPRYVPGDRVRTVEEVAADLNGLHLNVQIVQWNPRSNFGSVGCLVTNVKPDIIGGYVNVVSESCPNHYRFEISDATMDRLDARAASSLADTITTGRLDSVPRLNGRVQPTTTANVYTFSAGRVQE